MDTLTASSLVESFDLDLDELLRNNRPIYMCGKFAEHARMAKLMDEIRATGARITYDWTTSAHETARGALSSVAKKDMDGVKAAEIVIAVMDDPTYDYRGSFTEIGCAIGMETPVMIFDPWFDAEAGTSSAYCATNVFYYHPNVKIYNRWEDVLRMLDTRGRRMSSI